MGNDPFTVAICGGGIGGLSLAIGLQRHNVPFHLYEAASAFAEIGAGVSFGWNAIRAMALISPRIQTLYEKIDNRNPNEKAKTQWFDFQFGMDGRNPKHKAGHYVTAVNNPVGQSSVHRAHFLDGLVSLIPQEQYSFGKKVVSLTRDDKTGNVKLSFADGTTARSSVVIGCDGIKSNVRPMLLGESDAAAHAEFTGKYAYRGLVSMETAQSAVGEYKAQNSQMYMGYNGHVLTFPIENGKTMNVVAFRTKEDGGWENKE